MQPQHWADWLQFQRLTRSLQSGLLALLEPRMQLCLAGQDSPGLLQLLAGAVVVQAAVDEERQLAALAGRPPPLNLTTVPPLLPPLHVPLLPLLPLHVPGLPALHVPVLPEQPLPLHVPGLPALPLPQHVPFAPAQWQLLLLLQSSQLSAAPLTAASAGT